VQVPDDPAEPGTEQLCSDLVDALPDTVDGQSRRDVEPDLPYVAAWGDPAILLRCGVPQPEQYSPTAEVFPINGVPWLPVDGVGGQVFFTTDRSVWVRVDVPDRYAPEANALVDLADAVSTLPTDRPSPTPSGTASSP
jgi:hypothetical protein